jgi:hypothetical protein
MTDDNIVTVEGYQNIYGIKNFQIPPQCTQDPNLDEDLVRLKYYNDHLPAAGGNCSIETGSYIGDGAIDKKITTSITPKYVRVWRYREVDAAVVQTFVKTDGFGANWCIMNEYYMKDNRLTTLDVDGFHVDDDGIDADPNANGQTYMYLVLGT